MAVYNRYPQEVHDFVRENCRKLRDRELAAACNAALGTHFSASSIKSFRGNYGYKNGLGKVTREEYLLRQTKWPKGMHEYIAENSLGVGSKELAERVNEIFGTHWTASGIKQYRQRYGIKSGETGWYQKGHEPGTKGKTLEEICKNDPEKLAKVRATQFKKGMKPVNEMPIGAITATRNGYMIRKKQMEGTQWERWELLHRAIWEEHNGPIPEGMVVSFRDGNKENCSIDNLMLLTKRENQMLTRMNLRSGDPELTDAALAAVRLIIAAREKRKKGHDEENNGARSNEI